MRYEVHKAPGWHGEPDDPLVYETDDVRDAALMAGCRVDIHMPGDSNSHDCYAVDVVTGERVESIESYRCDRCGELREWGEGGPVGVFDGVVHECPRSLPKHLVEWCCEDCAYEDDDD